MTKLRLGLLVEDMRAILGRHGFLATAEFLALGIGVLTLEALLVPERFLARRAPDDEAGIGAVLFDPFLLLHEAAFACLFGLACLRVATDMKAGPDGPASEVLKRNLWPLIVLNMAVSYASYVGILMVILPGLLIAAVTTTLIPAILVEERGWQGLSHSIGQCLPNIAKLTACWAAIYLPALIMLIVLTPVPDAESTAPGLWAGMLVAELVSAILGAVLLALAMATWRQVSDSAGGGQLTDVFR
ncbi:hypothetical protein ACW9UR_01950 [Halovulum sp. GXIMD14794]